MLAVLLTSLYNWYTMSSKNPGAAGEAKSASPKKQARKSPRKRPAATVESTIYGLTEADAGILRELVRKETLAV